MFNKNFYPTPKEVIELMQIDCFGKIVLEPSAGKGDIIDYLQSNGSKKVLFCEIEPDLKAICQSKAEFITNDFLAVVREQVSHIDLIVMNPPFDKGAEHLLQAWNVAPDGCEIICLLNSATIDEYNQLMKRRELMNIIKTYGNSQNLGNCFAQAERKTNVEVSVIKLYKPISEKKTDFDSFFTDEEDEAFGGQEGILQYNEIRSIVQMYVQSLIYFDEFTIIQNKMNANNKHLGLQPFSVKVNHRENVVTKADFATELQKKNWSHIFYLMKLDKYLTSKVKEDLNKFLESESKKPFTMKNIFKMVDVIIGTRETTLKNGLVQSIDNFTRYTHENRYSIPGWKTNAGYMLNKKIILDRVSRENYDGSFQLDSYGVSMSNLTDLMKVICFITGNNFDKIEPLSYASCERDEAGNIIADSKSYGRAKNDNNFVPGQWYNHYFFDFKIFKKGTLHLKFKDLKVWENLNREYAKIKGQVLPDKI